MSLLSSLQAWAVACFRYSPETAMFVQDWETEDGLIRARALAAEDHLAANDRFAVARRPKA